MTMEIADMEITLMTLFLMIYQPKKPENLNIWKSCKETEEQTGIF